MQRILKIVIIIIKHLQMNRILRLNNPQGISIALKKLNQADRV